MENKNAAHLNFENTESAFVHLSDSDLRKTNLLFNLMSINWLTGILSSLGMLAIRLRLPGARYVIEKTLFKQFCGGKSLEESREVIEVLWKHNIQTYLDFGVEGKTTESEYEDTLEENAKAVSFANRQKAVPIVVTKVTGLSSNILLEKMTAGKELTEEEQLELSRLENRLESLALQASETDTSLYIDAEESWYQVAIDNLALSLMKKFNAERPVVYNTYQLYRSDKLEQLMTDIEKAKEEGYFFGAKLVRGAYMEKEARHASVTGIESPIHKTKAATDEDYNKALLYCLDNVERVGFCCASHNDKSNELLASEIVRRGIPRDHKHVSFCQLYGMSNNITFNLAEANFNAAKYVVYGPVEEVFPYLVRRAEENNSVTGEMGRELTLIRKEMKRRGLK